MLSEEEDELSSDRGDEQEEEPIRNKKFTPEDDKKLLELVSTKQISPNLTRTQLRNQGLQQLHGFQDFSEANFFRHYKQAVASMSKKHKKTVPSGGSSAGAAASQLVPYLNQHLSGSGTTKKGPSRSTEDEPSVMPVKKRARLNSNIDDEEEPPAEERSLTFTSRGRPVRMWQIVDPETRIQNVIVLVPLFIGMYRLTDIRARLLRGNKVLNVLIPWPDTAWTSLLANEPEHYSEVAKIKASEDTLNIQKYLETVKARGSRHSAHDARLHHLPPTFDAIPSGTGSNLRPAEEVEIELPFEVEGGELMQLSLVQGLVEQSTGKLLPEGPPSSSSSSAARVKTCVVPLSLRVELQAKSLVLEETEKCVSFPTPS